jgi:hypothetical protein
MTADQKTDRTTAARSREPVATPYEVGLSSRVKEQLSKIAIHPSIKERIADHLCEKELRRKCTRRSPIRSGGQRG